MTKNDLKELKGLSQKLVEISKSIHKFAPDSEERKLIGHLIKSLEETISKIDFTRLESDEVPEVFVGQVLRGPRE